MLQKIFGIPAQKQSVDDFFKNKNPQLRKLNNAYLKLARRIYPKVIINVDKTRISFQARTCFAGVSETTKDTLYGGFWLKHKITSPRFTKVEFIPPNNYVYRFPIKDISDLDEEVTSWIKDALKVGQQEN